MFCFSLPAVANHLQILWAQAAWSLALYFIVVAAFLNLFRQAAGRHGGIRILRLGFLLFAVGSLLCCFAHGWLDLLLYRLLQALGAACLQATMFGLFVEYIPLPGYPTAVHRSSFMLFFGLVFGFVLGGLAVYWLSWQWGFAALALLSLIFYLLALPIKCNCSNKPVRYDFIGIGLFIVIVGTFMWGLARVAEPRFEHATAHVVFLVTVVALLAFLLYESRREEPFMKLSLYRDSGFTLAMLAKFVHAFVTTVFFLMPAAYLIYVRDFPVLLSLWIALMAPLGVTIASVFEYVLAKKYKGTWFVVISSVFFVVPVPYICFIDAGSVDIYSALMMLIFGLGSGFLQQFLLRHTFAVLQESPPRVGTTYRAMHNVGCAFAVIVSAFFMQKYWQAQWDNLNAAISYAFYTCLVLIILVLVFAALRGVAHWVARNKQD
jgi:MFS family permease